MLGYNLNENDFILLAAISIAAAASRCGAMPHGLRKAASTTGTSALRIPRLPRRAIVLNNRGAMRRFKNDGSRFHSPLPSPLRPLVRNHLRLRDFALLLPAISTRPLSFPTLREVIRAVLPVTSGVSPMALSLVLNCSWFILSVRSTAFADYSLLAIHLPLCECRRTSGMQCLLASGVPYTRLDVRSHRR
jgi:hypothetical protein